MEPQTEAAIRNWSATAEGWCTVDRALEMAQLIIECHTPLTVVEIGVFAGGSLIPQALALKQQGTGKIYAIDPWSRDAALEQAFIADDTTSKEAEEIARKWWAEVDLNKMHQLTMEGIWANRLDDFVVVIRARSQDVAQLFEWEGIDILYIDGSHSEPSSCRDVELYVPLVRSGGFVWFDDANWQSTKKAVQMLNESCDLERDHEQYRLYRKR